MKPPVIRVERWYKERWVSIDELPKYELSDWGNVRHIRTKHILPLHNNVRKGEYVIVNHQRYYIEDLINKYYPL
jgi:hypothetical protein